MFERVPGVDKDRAVRSKQQEERDFYSAVSFARKLAKEMSMKRAIDKACDYYDVSVNLVTKYLWVTDESKKARNKVKREEFIVNRRKYIPL